MKREIVRPPERLFPPDEWRIVEVEWSPEYTPRAETVLALSNGYVGVRGTVEEGRPVLAPGTFVNGFHETWPIMHAEEAFGLARVGQTIVNVPDATVFELFVDDEPLVLSTARLREYARILDMRNGTLTRDLLWSTGAGKHVRVRSCRLVSLEHRHVVAMSYEVTVDQPSPVVIVSRVLDHGTRSAAPPAHFGERDPRRATPSTHRVLVNCFAEGRDGRMLLGYRTSHSGNDPRGRHRPLRRSDLPLRRVDVRRPGGFGARSDGGGRSPPADSHGQVRHVPELPGRTGRGSRGPLHPDP